MKDKLDELGDLIFKRETLEMRIEETETDISDITRAIIKIVGSCHHCKHAHYPFCDEGF